MQRVPSPVVVRPATDADLPTAVRLRAQANPDIIVSLDGMRLWLSDAPENALLRMFLAERDGVAAGWAVAMRAWHQSDPAVGMVDVMVDEEYRRQGVGSALATQAFRASGFDANNMAGGLVAWAEKGLPLEPDDGSVAPH